MQLSRFGLPIVFKGKYGKIRIFSVLKFKKYRVIRIVWRFVARVTAVGNANQI